MKYNLYVLQQLTASIFLHVFIKYTLLKCRGWILRGSCKNQMKSVKESVIGKFFFILKALSFFYLAENV